MKWVYEKRKYILFLALAVWMGLIFGFSHQKAAQSSEISGTITYRVAEGINEVFALDWEEETLKGYAKAWQLSLIHI